MVIAGGLMLDAAEWLTARGRSPQRDEFARMEAELADAPPESREFELRIGAWFARHAVEGWSPPCKCRGGARER